MALKLTSNPTVTAPPRRTPTPGRPAGSKPPTSIPDPRLEARQEAADSAFQVLGFGCILLGQFADAGTIQRHSPAVSVELVKLSENYESVGGFLDWLAKNGPLAGLFIAVMPMALQLLVNHNVMPAEMLAGAGVVRPEVIEAQVKAGLAAQAAEAIRQQREAEAELARQTQAMQSQSGPDTA